MNLYIILILTVVQLFKLLLRILCTAVHDMIHVTVYYCISYLRFFPLCFLTCYRCYYCCSNMVGLFSLSCSAIIRLIYISTLKYCESSSDMWEGLWILKMPNLGGPQGFVFLFIVLLLPPYFTNLFLFFSPSYTLGTYL